MTPTETFLKARDFLLEHREDYAAAYAGFSWPRLDRFNWAIDYFDVIAKGNRTNALEIVEDDGKVGTVTFDQLRLRSNRVASWLAKLGVRRGDRILMMLPNVMPLWEIMLAAMKVGAVLIPATTLLTTDDVKDRVSRGAVRHVIADASCAGKFEGIEGPTRIAVGPPVPGWHAFTDAYSEPATFTPDGHTLASDPMLLYFTSGTTAKPKLVMHTHETYPVGHLSTMYWIGVREGDVHLNISSPGWAKHAWSSFFAPWNAGATILVHNYARFLPRATLEVVAKHHVTTMCAPPTVWRMVVLDQLEDYRVKVRELLSAGEPLNPEVIERVRKAWGVTIRDGYGQTETTAQIGNTPGQVVKVGSMGRVLPGYAIAVLDPDDHPAHEGEICLPLDGRRPRGLMAGYQDDATLQAQVTRGGHYHTGDVAVRDDDGYFHYVGRADDVFKSSDYRISPFELESAIIEHAAIAEAAVVPSPDPVRGVVPKAFVIVKPGKQPSPELARDIFEFVRNRLAPYKRVRRIEFADLPKTISGKIRRVELRRREAELRQRGERSPHEYWQEDFG